MSLFTAKELKNYSFTKALSEAASGRAPGVEGHLTGLELECSDAIRAHALRMTGTEPLGPQIPWLALAPIGKSINVGNALQGGFLVGEDLEAVVPALRSASLVLALGAQTLTNLKGDIGIPAESSFQSASWLGESDALPDPGDQAYQRTRLAPRRLASMAVLSKQLLAQDSLGVENFVRASLRLTLGTALDKGAFQGVGGKEPVGLINNSGVGSVTFGASATRAKIISFQDTLTAANVNPADPSGLAFVTTPTASSKLMQISQNTGTSATRWLWEGNEWSGNMAGLPARATTNVSGDRLICGDFSQLVVGFWSEGFSILTDPFAQKKSGLVEIYASMFCDIAPANAANFVVSTDSAAQ